MFINGILAILQILFLPGLIFLKLFKPKGGFFYQLSVVVAISMLANATIIYPLVYLHLYTKTFVLVWMLLEVLALVWLYRGIFKLNFDQVGQAINTYASELWNQMHNLFQSERSSAAVRFLRNCMIALFGGLAIYLIFWFVRSFTSNIGSVFTNWDAVVSWNAWGQTWAQNQIPSVHLTYPQLLPLNLSLTYVLIGNYEVSLFAKAIMPIFALLTVLMVFEMALEKKQYGYLIAVVLIYLTYKKFMGDYITDGYADIPVAFMAIAALIPYLRNEDFLQDQKEVILSILLAAAAALTKQVGLFILVLLPILGLINSKTKSHRQTRQMLIWFGLGILLILPWYLPVGINALNDFSQLGFSKYIAHSSQEFDSDTPLIRLGGAVLSLGKYLALYIFLLPAFFVVKRRFKLLIPFFLIPFLILWGIVASYSARNLSITFATLAIICGLGLETLLEYGFRWLDHIKAGRLGAIFLLLLVIVPIGYFAWKLDDKKLIQTWADAQGQIFSPQLNDQIFALDRSNPDCKKILTNYPVDFLPGFRGVQQLFTFNDFDLYKQYINDPGVCWMLVPNGIDANVMDAIEQNLKNGTYELLYTAKNWFGYRLIKMR